MEGQHNLLQFLLRVRRAEHEHQQAAENDESGQSHLSSPLPLVRTHKPISSSLPDLWRRYRSRYNSSAVLVGNGYEYFAVRFLRKDTFYIRTMKTVTAAA